MPEAVLLGERQLKFLDAWGQDWQGADMKVGAVADDLLRRGSHSRQDQRPAACGSRFERLAADGARQGHRALRKCFALHFAGDQHLATIIHHGIDEFRDGGFSFCVPSIANLYLRWWEPLEPGRTANRAP